jgi:hypothetical protein
MQKELGRVLHEVDRLQRHPLVRAGFFVGLVGLYAVLETGWRWRRFRVIWS